MHIKATSYYLKNMFEERLIFMNSYKMLIPPNPWDVPSLFGKNEFNIAVSWKFWQGQKSIK